MATLRKKAYLVLRDTGLGRNLSKLRSFLQNKEIKRKYDKIISSGRVDNLKMAEFVTTMLCNLSCSMCHQKEYRAVSSGDLSLEGQIKCIDNIQAFGIKKIWLIGGEIFVRKDIFNLLDYLKDKKMFVDLATNGMFFNEETVDKLASYGNIEKIEFSLDGLKASHDLIRGLNGSFEKVVNAIKLTTDKQKFTVIVTLVLQRENLYDVKATIDLCRNLGVDVMNITMEMGYTDQEIKESAHRLGLSTSQLSVGRDNGFRDKFSIYDLKKIIDLINSENRRKMRVVLYPPIAGDFPSEFLEGSIRNCGVKLFCNAMALIEIDHNGEVLLCTFIKRSFGNARDKSLRDILNSEEFRIMRKRLLQGNLLPICKQCCALGYVK